MPTSCNQLKNSANQHLVIVLMRVMLCHVCKSGIHTARWKYNAVSSSAHSHSNCSTLPPYAAAFNGPKRTRIWTSTNMMTTEKKKNEFLSSKKKEIKRAFVNMYCTFLSEGSDRTTNANKNVICSVILFVQQLI